MSGCHTHFGSCRVRHGVRRVAALVGSLIALVVAACADRTDPASPVATAVRSTAAGNDTVDAAIPLGRERLSRSRFQPLDVSATGSFRPGTPIVLRIATTANLPTASADLRVFLLDAGGEVGRTDAGGGARPKPTPVARFARGYARGERGAEQVTVRFGRPGYYTVYAVTQSSDPTVVDGEEIDNRAHAVAWVAVSASGGGLVRQFDPSRVPGGVQSTPGPFRAVGGSATTAAVSCDAAGDCVCDVACKERRAAPQDLNRSGFCNAAIDPSCSDPAPPGYEPCYYQVWCLPPLPGCSGFRCFTTPGLTTVQVRYFDSTVGDWLPLPRAKVRVPYNGATYQADALGYARLNFCARPEFEIGIEALTDQPDVTVTGHRGDPLIVASYRVGVDQCNGTVTMYSFKYEQAEVFANMYRTIQGSRALLGVSRGKIRVDVLENVLDRTEYVAGTAERIEISSDEAFFSEGLYGLAHEYGHAVHQTALGGMPAGTCPANHPLTTVSDLPCALREGFAEYHGVAAVGTASGWRYTYIANNAARSATSTTDGSVVEGVVAAFLFDLAPAAVPGSYLAAVVQTCRVSTTSAQGTFTRANGIDHWVYCMERQQQVVGGSLVRIADPAVVQSYFRTRLSTSTPYGWADNAAVPSTWNASTIRYLWKCNLYGAC